MSVACLQGSYAPEMQSSPLKHPVSLHVGWENPPEQFVTRKPRAASLELMRVCVMDVAPWVITPPTWDTICQALSISLGRLYHEPHCH